MRYRGLDLNLLAALDVLLETCSVTAAADRLNLSQSAMSGLLSRLRGYFGDELLVFSGRRMVLTPHGSSLVIPVKACLAQIDATVLGYAPFDPDICDRRFAIDASDYVQKVMLSPLARRLAVSHPRMRLHISSRRDFSAMALNDGSLDVLITPEFLATPELPSELLFEDDFVIVGSEQNPHLHGSVHLDDFYELHHVGVQQGRNGVHAYPELYLPHSGRVRKIDIVVPSLTDAVQFVVDTMRITIMHRRLALHYARYLPISIVELPFVVPLLREVLQLHPTRNNDTAVQWLCHQMHEEVRNLAGV